MNVKRRVNRREIDNGKEKNVEERKGERRK
jgi:hypothetical protein